MRVKARISKNYALAHIQACNVSISLTNPQAVGLLNNWLLNMYLMRRNAHHH